ncbi:MAG: homoserine dehydrogenase [Anaerolineales bacterium]|nr:homoserine dehydrogenase [Anaerolineales bacterium]
MKTYKLFFLGFGTIGRALARLLLEKDVILRDMYGVSFATAAVATRRHGCAMDPAGLDLSEVLRHADSGAPIGKKACDEKDLETALRASRADILVELTPTDRASGEPAIAHIRTALQSGMHVVTANKGPVAFAYRELRDLAEKAGRRFLFEAAVMDGTPVFSLRREALPSARILGFRAILNSTTNYLLGRMEEGMDFEEAVGAAQKVGIAETDPMADVEGWDAVLKVAALVNVWMEYPMRPEEVFRQGIGGLNPAAVRRARSEGRPYKLVCRAARAAAGVAASVRPEQVAADDPLASVRGTGTMLCLESDALPGLSISGAEPSPRTTAYGLLSDILSIARGEPPPSSSPV